MRITFFLTFTILIFLSLGTRAEQKKNLLIIMTDQQRYDALSIAGNTVLKTPNLDRLATQGAYFQNAYSPSAVCCPARSSILTGHTVENTGMKNNDAYYDVDKSIMAMPTFDEILTDKGYHCEYYGKWHTSSYHSYTYKNPQLSSKAGNSIFGPGGQSRVYLDYLDEHAENRSLQDGEFYDLISHFPYRSDPLDKYHGMTAAQLAAQNKKHSQPDQHGELQLDQEHTFTAFQAKQTIEAIERLKDTTFSITCSFHFPHSPVLPAEPYYSMYPASEMIAPESIGDDLENSPYKKANGRQGLTDYADPEKIKYLISNYYGLVTEIDDWVGKIMEKLDELGLTENTMVIFTSDHGEMLGSHGMREKNVFYEESSHIPLMIRYPNIIPEATTVDGYVSLIDLFPTILDYLDAPEHDSNGKSLRGLIDGTDTEHGEYVVTEWDFRGDGESNYMVVKDGWKLMIPYTISSKVINAMYDLNTDPLEMNNLLGSNPNRADFLEQAEELRACLLEWLEKNKSSHIYSVKHRNLLEGGESTGNGAAFIAQDIPTLEMGATIEVSITMKNTGTSSWNQEGQYFLGSQGPTDNKNWGLNRVALDPGESIEPNAEKTFTFEITVPEHDGVYHFSWKMLQEGEEWFGTSSPNLQFTIGDPGSFLDACDALTDWKSSAGLVLNNVDKQQGTGCIEFTGSSTDEYKKTFKAQHNSGATMATGSLEFWYYISDPSLMGDKNQVELGSGGAADKDELNWALTEFNEGWNFISLKFSDAGVLGSPNLNAINWFRIYNKKSGSVSTRIDAIKIVDPNAEKTFELTVNNGDGSGNFAENESININANTASSGKEFDTWVVDSGNASIEDKHAASTSLTMPANDVVVTATYKDIQTGIKPVDSDRLSVRVYPNPLKDNLLNLELTGFNHSKTLEISITNLVGQIVFHTTKNSARHIAVNINGPLKSSSYLLTVKSSQSVITTKLMVE